MEKTNPFNKIKDLALEDKKELKEKDNTTVSEVIQHKLEKKAVDLKERNTMKNQDEFIQIQEEISLSTNTNYIFLLFAPIIGFLTGPAMFLLALDINDEQFRIMKIALIGNAIGLVLTVIMVLIAFRDGIRKTVLGVYRHFFTQKEISDYEGAHIIEARDAALARNKELEEEVKQLNKDLYEYNLEKEIKKRELKKE